MTRFWLWKSGESGAFAQRLAGSSDLFQQTRQVHNSINFITAHDGFTLRDLVSYNEKHNWANGENNRDGRNHNYSYNHGVEGIDNVPSAVENGRLLSSIALLMNLLLANGTPMLLAGTNLAILSLVIIMPIAKIMKLLGLNGKILIPYYLMRLSKRLHCENK